MTSLPPEARQLKERIMDKYFELGVEQGFSKVLLDQVASELSISKKTIYKFFPSKEQIISACIDTVFGKIDAEILPIMNNPSLDVLDKIKILTEKVAGHLSFFTRLQVIEIQRTFPELWSKILEQRKIRIERYDSLFQYAQQNGYFIDIDSKIILHFFLNTIEAFTSESFLEEHDLSYSESLHLATKILLDGVLKRSAN